MRMRLSILLALLLTFALFAFGQAATAPVPEHSAAEKAMGGPVQLALMLLFVGMVAVFFGLFAIYLFLVFLRRVFEKKSPLVTVSQEGGTASQQPLVITAEMASAIALALYMDLRTFDEGTAEEITIRKITRPFSPWWNAAKTQIIFDKVEMFRRKY